MLLSCAVVLLLVAVGAGAFALRSADRARRDAAAVVTARAQALAGLSMNAMVDDRSLALLLGVEAQRIDDSAATRGAILTALFGQPFQRTSIITPATDHMAIDVDDGGTVAVAKRADGLLDVVDLGTRRMRHVGLESPASPVGGVDVDRSGKMVVSSGVPTQRGTVVYDLDNGDELTRIPNDDAFFHWARFTPDGKLLSVADGSGIVRLYDTMNWEQVAEIDTGLGAPISATAFDSTGGRLFVATIDPFVSTGLAKIVVIDVATRSVELGPVDGVEPLISSIAVGPGDDEVLLAGSWIDRRRIDTLERVGERFGQTEIDGLVTLAVGPTGTVVVGSPLDLRVFDDVETAQMPIAAVFDSGAPGVVFVGDGSTLVTADVDGSVSTWNATVTDAVGSPLQPPSPGQVSSSPDGSTLIVWDDERGVALYERASLRRRAVLDIEPGNRVVGVDTDDAGQRLVTLTCPWDPSRCEVSIDVWELATGRRLVGPKTVGPAWSGLRKGVVFTRRGTQVAAALGTGVVGFWDAATLEGEPGRPKMADHTAVGGNGIFAIASAEVSGRSLIAAHDDLGQSVVWDVTGEQPTVTGTLENAFRMDFDPDGRLITSSGPGSLVVRDPFTLEPVSDVMPGSLQTDSYDVADDGTMVASGDVGAMLWDLADNEQLSGAIPAARSVLAPDGSMLYLGSGPLGEEVRAVSLHPTSLTVAACEQAGRNLTIAEWNRTMGSGEPYRPTCEQWPSGLG